jgi:hypothetical protein
LRASRQHDDLKVVLCLLPLPVFRCSRLDRLSGLWYTPSKTSYIGVFHTLCDALNRLLERPGEALNNIIASI